MVPLGGGAVSYERGTPVEFRGFHPGHDRVEAAVSESEQGGRNLIVRGTRFPYKGVATPLRSQTVQCRS